MIAGISYFFFYSWKYIQSLVNAFIDQLLFDLTLPTHIVTVNNRTPFSGSNTVSNKTTAITPQLKSDLCMIDKDK